MTENKQPEGWVAEIVADCFDQISTTGTKVKAKEYKESGLYPVIDQGQEFISGFIDDSKKLITLDKPVIVFGDHTRSIKWVDFDFVPGADGTKILSPKEYLFSRIAFYELKNLKIPDKGYARHFKFLKELEIPIPPLAEQKIIAEKLDTLLAQVETTKARLERIPKTLKTFRQSVLSAAVSGKLTEEWRGNAEYSIATHLPLLWKNEKASDVCDKVQSGSTPRNEPFNQNGTVPFLKVYNIVDQKINFDYKPQFVTKEVHREKLKRSIGFPNDVLMNIVGPPLGKVAILTSQYPEWNFNQAITLFRPNVEILNSKYLYFVLCEGGLVRRVMPDTKGTVGQVNISLTQCREALIPLPPNEEQTQIVRRVEDLFAFADNIEQKANAALERVNNLTQSILAKAFRGELTADWRAANPELISGENSAEALLEKIKVERETMKSNKKTVIRKKA